MIVLQKSMGKGYFAWKQMNGKKGCYPDVSLRGAEMEE